MKLDPNLGSSLVEYIPGRARSNKSRKRSTNPIARAAAKRLAQVNNNADLYKLPSEKPRKQRALPSASFVVTRSRPHGRINEEDGEDLARSNIPLPSDRGRLVRRPTLEREDAFRDASTSKGNVRLRRSAPAIYGDEDAQVAELYRIGLLYDADESDRTEAFNLNCIQHEQALYPIRASKRARRGKARRGELHLDLSFTDLGDDNNIARYLVSPLPESSDHASQHSSRRSSQADVPLRVVYELATATPSYDVDTSQPPDLIDDSDYDCLSEAEFDDLPSQQEVYDSAANPPTDSWIMLGDGS